MNKMKTKIENNKLKGFSLLEAITAIFIFSLVVVITVSVFAGAFKSRVKSKEVQQAMEDTRFAMEIMAKNIRMSTIDHIDANRLYIYNYSQDKCIKYEFTGNNLTAGEISLASRLNSNGSINSCSPASKTYTSQNMLKAGSLESGWFFATKSDDDTVGVVTIIAKVDGSPNAMQTTVSLRDFIK